MFKLVASVVAVSAAAKIAIRSPWAATGPQDTYAGPIKQPFTFLVGVDERKRKTLQSRNPYR